MFETTHDLYDAGTGRRLAAATPAQAQASEDASVEGGGYGVIAIAIGGVCAEGSGAARQPGARDVFAR